MAWRLSFPVDEAVEVAVTHVERDTGNFFVHLVNSDSSKLDDLMEEIVSYVAHNSSGSAKARSLKVGDVCLAKYVDEVWYRGKILGVDGNGFKVFFVDYGNSDFVVRNDVMPAPEKFVSLPPQAYECELANVKPVGGQWGTETLVKFEELILEQTFVAQAVSMKTNNVLVLSLFQDATMTTLAVEPLISDGFMKRLDKVPAYVESGPNRSYKFLDLENFSFEDVHISYCENPDKFHCILLKNSTALHRLMEELEGTYKDATEDEYPLTSCCQNNPCCAKYSEDDNWYRAIITSESPSPSGEIIVKFVDYGNSESVHISSLMELNDRFLELPMQALECSLYGVKPVAGEEEWSQDAIDLFVTLTTEKHLVTYINTIANNIAEVFLFDTSEETKDINYAQVLVESGKAIAVKSLTDYKKARPQRRKSSFGIINLEPNSREEVVVTNVDSPSDFYCQLLKHSPDLDRLMNELSQYYDNIGDVDDTVTLPQAGMLCCGCYTEDDGWYRALILASDIANRQVEVLYVDYGNAEFLPITRIKELKPQFASLPQQAIPCCLYGVSPNANSWTDKAIEEFQNAVVEKELMIKVVSHNESQRYSVSLMETVGEEVYSINKQLVQKGLAISDGSHPGVSVDTDVQDYHPPPVEVGNYIDIEITHVENLDQFWCHLMTSSNDEMESLMANLQDYYEANPPKGTDLNQFRQGSPCCARFSEDEMWYRAKILEKMSNNRFQVRFIDYGNCEVLASKSVAVLNPEFLQLPVQAIKCTLANVPSSEKKKDKFVREFFQMVDGKELVCRLEEQDKNGKYVVLIIDTVDGLTININEKMAEFIANAGKQPSKESSVKNVPKVAALNLTTGKEESVYITCVNSLGDFYCQLANTSAQLDNLMNNMESFYRPLAADDEILTDPQAGNVCCAMFTADDGFYRAVVTKVSSGTVGVHYIDYGNCEELPLSRVKNLNVSFAKLPAQCFNAKMLSSGCGTTEEFEAIVTDKELKAKIIKKDENGIYVVSLSDSNGTPLFSKGAASQQQQGTSKQLPCKVNETRIPVGKKVHVFITCVTSPDDFFCQLSETSAQLDDLMNKMEEHYRPLGKQQEAYINPQIGEACCAVFTEDDGFYRATVTNHTGIEIDVNYMDYGNSESISQSRVKILHQKFTTLPRQGFHASVKTPTTVSAAAFKDSLLEKEFDVTIVKESGNNMYEVELFGTDGTKMFEGAAANKKEAYVCQVKEPDIVKGSKEHVYVTFFTSPESFFCQRVKTSTHLDELMDRLEEFYRPLADGDECLTNPQMGDTCCAMFSEDDGWYRAVITKVSGKTVEVRYLDYGNSEELPLSRVKRLLPCFAETNIQGFSASLIGSGNMEKVRAAVDGKELMVRVSDRKRDGAYNVEVYEMNGNRLFASEQDAGKPKDIKTIKDFLNAYNVTPGAQLDVCGSHCESPNLFYLHLVKNKETLEKIMTELCEVYSDLRPEDNAVADPVVGLFCAAKYPVDGGWYRAQILSIPSPNEVEVCYIDFGNRERLGLRDIKNLAPAFYNTAVQAVKCRLPEAKEKWNPNECEAFEILVLEQHLIADVKSLDANTKTLTIDLIDTRGSENLNILNALSGKTSEKSSKSQEKLPKLAALPKLQLKDVENVLVESAESLDSFVCQFSRFNHDLDTVADMMYDVYHQGTPPDFVTTPLQVGDVMAAIFSEDETWYRATVSDKNPDGSVCVTFIDYGNSESISKADVAQKVRYLTKDLLRYPPLRGVACSLSRVSTDGQRFSWTPRAHDAFVRYVVDKEFRARLSSDSEPYKTILEDLKSGSLHTWLVREKLVAGKDSEPEVVQDDFYELEVEVGTSCDVYVTSVVNPENFFVQQVANTEAIDKVMDDLHVSCTDGSRGMLMNIKTGTLCAAQYTVDDAWYRARVTQGTRPDSYEVVFVDYGNGEVLPRERIKELDPSFLELPAQALCCSLQLKQPMSWNVETVERFENATLDKLLKMTVVKALDGKLLVTMKDEEGSLLNDMFDSHDSTGQAPGDEIVEVTLPPFPVTGMQTAEVYISHLVSPGDFHVQFSTTEEELERLAEKAAQLYDGPKSENYKVNNPQQSMFCCARYSEDQAWYRAQITSVDLTNQTAAVRFVDHGNTDVVNLSSDLRQLTADLSRSPCQAIACSLGRGTWSPEQCSSFEVAAIDKPLQATFNEYFDNTWLVSLKDGSISLDQLLNSREETPFIKMPCLSAKDEPSVYIVSIKSAADVVLQLSSHVSDLEALMSDIADNPPQANLPIAERECGMYCLARFTEDEAWYRAKVLECDGDKAMVLYIDYGNEEWITGDRLAPISAQFCNLPEVCFRCSLDLSSFSGTWTEDSGEKLFEMYGEHELRCQIMSKTDDCFSVKLFCGDQNILTKIVSPEEPTPTVKVELNVEAPSTPAGYKIKPIQKGDRKDVICSHIESPSKLWCQFSEDQETLHDVMNRLDEVYSVLGAGELQVESYDAGAPCCGQFLEDDGWYRAEILGMQDQGVMVRYIDYGNEEVLPASRVRCLQSEFFATPRQAVACLLKGIQASGDEWSPDALTLVEGFTSERSLSLEVASVDVLTIIGVIYGRLEGEEEISLSDLLVKKLLAVNVSQQSSEEQSDQSEIVVSYTNIPIQLGDKINLFYVSADSPESIWCQLSDSENELLDLMEKLGAFYGNLDEKDWAVEEPLATGAAVCAQFTGDDSWYRAEILETSPSIVVRFVDYGNCEELPHTRVKRLKQDFAVLPKQAICFALSGVSSQSLKEWSEEKKIEMEELCSDKCYVGEVLEIPDSAMVISLEDHKSHVMLLDDLCQANLVVKKLEGEVSMADVSTAPDEQPVDESSASEEQPADETSALEEHPEDSGSALREQLVEETPTSEERRADDISVLEEQPVDDTSALEEQPVDDISALEEQPVDDTSALEEQPGDDTSALEEQPVDDTSALEEQPVDDTSALEEQPVDDTSALEEQPVDDTSALEEQPGDDTSALEEQPVDDTSALQEQPEDSGLALREQPGDDTSALEEQPVDDTSASEEQPGDDTSALEEQPVDDTSALQEQPEDSGLALEEQPGDDTSASEEQLVDDTSALQEQPEDSGLALREQPGDDTSALEEQPVDDTSALEEQPGDDTSALEEQPVDDTSALQEQPEDSGLALREQPGDDTSASEEQLVDDTSTSEEQQVDDTSTLEKQPGDNTSTLEEQPGDDTPASEKPPGDGKCASEEKPADDISTSEEQPVNEASKEQQAINTPTFEEKPQNESSPDERPPIKAENQTRTASPDGDSEEDLNDAAGVCHAIDRLITEIETRTGEGDHSSTQDRELVEEKKISTSEEAIVIIPSEEAPSKKITLESTLEDDPNSLDYNLNTNSDVDLDEKPPQSEKDVIDTVQKISAGNLDEIQSSESSEMFAIVQENQSAQEGDSTSGSSNATPFLSPVGELTDDSPSDEMSAYLTPPSELAAETVAQGQELYSSPESDRTDNRRRYAYPEIQLGDIHKVKISYIQSPSSFFCQLSRTEIEFSHLMETIQKTFSEGTEDVDVPTVGNPCCAQSLEDDKWYRAVVRHFENDDDVNVTLVDIGKTLCIPVERIKGISDELVTCLPRQALHCSLVDLEPAEGEWSADAVTKMTKVCSGKELEGIFRSRYHKVYNIYLRDPENDASDFVNKLLVDLKLAKVTGRDSDSGEGTDSNGNSESNQGSNLEEKTGQLTTNGSHNENYQSECNRNETIEIVKDVLDNMLDIAIKQAPTLQTGAKDILNMGEDVTCIEIQQEVESTKMTSDAVLCVTAVLDLSTKTIEHDSSESVDHEEEIAAEEMREDMSEMEKSLENVEKCGEFQAENEDICGVVNVEPNDFPAGNEEDEKQTNGNTDEIEKEAVESEKEALEDNDNVLDNNQEFVDRDQDEEIPNNESASTGENDTDVQNHVGDTGAAKEGVNTDMMAGCDLSNEKLVSEEQEEKADIKSKDGNEHIAPEHCPDQGGDASVNTRSPIVPTNSSSKEEDNDECDQQCKGREIEDIATPSNEHNSSTVSSTVIEDEPAQDPPVIREEAQEIVEILITEVCYTECSELASQTEPINQSSSQEIEPEERNLQIANEKGHKKDDSESFEDSVDKELKQSAVGNVDDANECGSNTQGEEIVNNLENSEERSSDKLSSDVENDKFPMEKDSLGNASENATLETLVSDVVSRVEVLRGKDEDLDID